jgi:hypothetical protein
VPTKPERKKTQKAEQQKKVINKFTTATAINPTENYQTTYNPQTAKQHKMSS